MLMDKLEGVNLEKMFVFEANWMGYHVIILDPKPNSSDR